MRLWRQRRIFRYRKPTGMATTFHGNDLTYLLSIALEWDNDRRWFLSIASIGVDCAVLLTLPAFFFVQEIREKSVNYSISESRKIDNRDLNRYRDVNPFDHSRIVLARGNCCYINASLVKVSDHTSVRSEDGFLSNWFAARLRLSIGITSSRKGLSPVQYLISGQWFGNKIPKSLLCLTT